MNYHFQELGEAVEVKLGGRLTFAAHGMFRDLLERIKGHSGRTVTMDVSGLEYLDSSGLGMLLMLRDTSSDSSVKLSFTGPRGQVQRLLRTTRFDTLLPITG